jgi:hypothetical protein
MADNMTVYLENPKQSIEKLLEYVNHTMEYKVNIQKLLLYTVKK